jgi:Ca2+-binding RTX toxin-like protein
MWGRRVIAATFGCLLISAPCASAAVNASEAGGSTITLASTGGGDTISGLTCAPDGKVNYNGDFSINCTDLAGITITGGSGNDTINVGNIGPAIFPNMNSVRIDGQAGSDVVTGSGFDDAITADASDVVAAGPGEDTVVGGGQVSGGDGDDDIANATAVDGGPGDDFLDGSTGGPIAGGAGEDTFNVDFVITQNLNDFSSSFTLSDTQLVIGLPSPVPPGTFALSSVDRVDLNVQARGSHTVDASAFSGDLRVTTGKGDDKITGGSGDDSIFANGGSDVITGGPGIDIVKAGSGADTLNLRDDGVDRGGCSDGADTAVVDQDDILTDCETVDRLDKVPPFTLDLSGPTSIKQGKKAKFSFGSSEAGGTFSCQIDKEKAAPCSSPFKLKTKKLDPGKHTFSVAAVDAAGNADPTPATLKFTVEKKKKKPKK